MSSPEVLDFGRLLAPISDHQPSGAELKVDGSLRAMYYEVKDAREAARTAERELLRQVLAGENHGEGPAGERPNWPRVRELAVEIIAEHSKDLWVAAWLIEALARTDGFAGLRDGFRLTRELAEQFWDGIHPQPDEDGYLTTVAQLTGLNGADSEGVLVAPIKAIPITHSTTYGALSSAAYYQAQNLAKADPTRQTEALERGAVSVDMFDQAVRETPHDFLATLLADIKQCQVEFDRFNKVLEERCGTDADGYSMAPPSSNLRHALAECHDLVRTMAPSVQGPEPVPAELGPGDGQVVQVGDGNHLPVQTREQAFQALLRVANYFRQSEPHSPVSYALEQAVRWGRMPLPELLTELIPDESARTGMFRLTGIPPGKAPESK
ncbi:MAG: hypothetical protein A2W31_01425 [Planctomycetes bacterium RBG_16_64_10]|nr:MAG: hypothetical protein A2W31_01425 [Planctomycetes bacterium RBG_16_64_10]